MTTEELIALLNEQHKEIRAGMATSDQTVTGMAGRLAAVEQALAAARTGGFSAPARQSWGAQVSASDPYKQFVGQMGKRGAVKVPIKNDISFVTGSGGDTLVAPDRKEIVGLPQQKLTIRSLLAPGQTNSNLVQYPRMVSRDNAAAPVAEGQEKPESSLVFELAEAPVRTIAHWIPVSRQAMDDAPQLQSLIDSELRYGLALSEEGQLLGGDGTGENILGLVPQATPYDPPFSVDMENMLDVLLLAIAQAQLSLLPATGIVVNDQDWKRMQALKDGQGRYLGQGPFGAQPAVAWTLPVVDTPSMAPGEFLVGSFALAAQIFDRMETEVLISSEDRDNFIKNMLTVRAEERLALAVKRPTSLVTGSYPSGV